LLNFSRQYFIYLYFSFLDYIHLLKILLWELLNTIKYDIVFSDKYIKFTNCINYRINHGWKLQGGIFVDDGMFYQAIVKEDENE
jgi:hypothetical protein